MPEGYRHLTRADHGGSAPSAGYGPGTDAGRNPRFTPSKRPLRSGGESFGTEVADRYRSPGPARFSDGVFRKRPGTASVKPPDAG